MYNCRTTSTPPFSKRSGKRKPSMKVLLVGCGKMGSAMMSRWIALDLCSDIQVIEPSSPQYLPSPDQLPQGYAPNVVVFAVKPQTLPNMIGAYKIFAGSSVFISIAAGKKISFFEDALSTSAQIVRAMPNTPAAIGKGVTVACANSHVSAQGRLIAEQLLSAVGTCLWTENENDINAVTALSGSGPAYVFHLIEAMTTAGIANGLSPEMSAALARQTVIGSAALAETESNTPPETLRKNVTSPGGTTEAALKVLMTDDKLSKLMVDAITAARKRAEELAG